MGEPEPNSKFTPEGKLNLNGNFNADGTTRYRRWF
jgi:hypothetical protein